jgi:hypothetical protein
MNRGHRTFGVGLATMIALLPCGTTAKKKASRYLCVSDAVAGFHYDKQTDQWRQGALEGKGPGKYILRRITDND